LDPVRLELTDVAANAGGFQLEHAGRLARTEKIEGLLVVQRDVFAADLDPALEFDEPEGVLEDGEVPESEEVELQHTELLELLVLVLRLEGVDVALRALERHELGDGLARDHNAGRVRARRAHDPFDLL